MMDLRTVRRVGVLMTCLLIIAGCAGHAASISDDASSTNATTTNRVTDNGAPADASSTSAPTAIAAVPTEHSTRTRAFADLPDDLDGWQIHVMYVLPSDGEDRSLDLDGAIVTSVNAIDTWLASQTGGRRLRLDTVGGALDITFARLHTDDATLRAAGVYVRDKIEEELRNDGVLKPMKMYAVLYDGSCDHSCGAGPWPPALVGQVTALYLRGTPPGAAPCISNVFGAPGGRMGYWDFALLHELMHAMGAVGERAPHHTRQGHVSDEPRDLMYAGDQPWRPEFLDVGHDDYFEHGHDDYFDLALSVFLTPQSADAAPPPGWHTNPR